MEAKKDGTYVSKLATKAIYINIRENGLQKTRSVITDKDKSIFMIIKDHSSETQSHHESVDWII
jgi:hypothetical protein